MNKILKNINPKLTLEKIELLYDRIDFSKPIEVVDILYLKDVEPHRKRYIGSDGVYRKSTNSYVRSNFNSGVGGVERITKEEFYKASEEVIKYIKLKAFEIDAKTPHMTMFRIENDILYESDNQVNL